MRREGRELKTLAPGDRRRLSDARNAWRKMTPEQRATFLDWLLADQHETIPPGWRIVGGGY
jgi:hypothetical protein